MSRFRQKATRRAPALALRSTSSVRVGQAPKLALGEAVEVACEGYREVHSAGSARDCLPRSPASAAAMPGRHAVEVRPDAPVGRPTTSMCRSSTRRRGGGVAGVRHRARPVDLM